MRYSWLTIASLVLASGAAASVTFVALSDLPLPMRAATSLFVLLATAFYLRRHQLVGRATTHYGLTIAEMQTRLEELNSRLGDTDLDHELLHQQIADTERDNKLLHQQIADTARDHANLRQQIADTARDHANLRQQMAEQIEKSGRWVQTMTQQLEALQKEQTKAEQATASIEGQIERQASSAEKARHSLKESIDSLANHRDRIVQLYSSLLDQTDTPPTNASLNWLEETQTKAMSVWGADNRALFLEHRRRMTAEAAGSIAHYWSDILGREISDKAVGYLAFRAEEVERQCIGRLAGVVEDAVIRSLLMQSLHGERLDAIEIGTLFAVNTAFLLDTSVGFFDRSHFTCIDPFFGYYEERMDDITTGFPISEAAARSNFGRLGFTEESFTIVRSLSEDEKALSHCQDIKCNYLFIDGDHSYEGVARDYENYVEFVTPGGLIIFDDYAFTGWPGVGKFIDERVKADSRVELVGHQFHTIAFRKIG